MNQPSLFDKPIVIDESKNKFHGSTYDETKDRARLSGQMKRLSETIQDGEWHNATTMCEEASVSYSALRNRISDLRTYHAFKIESERVREGLWKYRFTGIMAPEEHRKYLSGLKSRKMKPVGNPELWGKLMKSIYAYAFHRPGESEASGEAMDAAYQQWAVDMVQRLRAVKSGSKPDWMTPAEYDEMRHITGAYDFHD